MANITRALTIKGATALVAVLLLFCSSWQSLAQTYPFELWHEGKVVLESGDTLKGLVKYDLTQDIVQFSHPDKSVEAFSSRKILFFEIFDNTVHRYRQFFSLPYSTAGSYRTLIFFELLTEGKMTLLAREAMEYRTYYTGFYGGSYTRLVLVNKYFIMDEKANINAFTGNKNDLLNLMGRKGDDVDKFIKTNRLKYDEKYDFARIVEYYNTLIGS